MRLNLSIFAINLVAILAGIIWIESLDIVGLTLLLSIPCYYLELNDSSASVGAFHCVGYVLRLQCFLMLLD